MTTFSEQEFQDYLAGVVEALRDLDPELTQDQAEAKVKERLGSGLLPSTIESGGTQASDMIFHETPEFWAKCIYYGRRDWWRQHS